jgi:hypothetical protein
MIALTDEIRALVRSNSESARALCKRRCTELVGLLEADDEYYRRGSIGRN